MLRMRTAAVWTIRLCGGYPRPQYINTLRQLLSGGIRELSDQELVGLIVESSCKWQALTFQAHSLSSLFASSWLETKWYSLSVRSTSVLIRPTLHEDKWASITVASTIHTE